MSGFKQNYVNEGNNPYIVAEIGIYHNGVIDLAKK
jgi:sialic acid synthase SpsE